VRNRKQYSEGNININISINNSRKNKNYGNNISNLIFNRFIRNKETFDKFDQINKRFRKKRKTKIKASSKNSLTFSDFTGLSDTNLFKKKKKIAFSLKSKDKAITKN
jgi:hypothetical protein